MNPQAAVATRHRFGRQAMMALGYLSIFLMPTLLAVGVHIGHSYLAFGVVMLVFPLARSVFGAYRPGPAPLWDERIATLLDVLPIAYGVALLLALGYVIWALHKGSVQTASEMVGTGLSLWATLFFATCPAHDLIHRRDAKKSAIGHLIAGVAGYPLLGAEHPAHHARFGDTMRAEWPMVSESVWQFAWRRTVRVVADAKLRGSFRWTSGPAGAASRNMRLALMSTFATWALFCCAASWSGFDLYLGVIVGVTFGNQLATYLQHWGLGTDSLPEASTQQFAWEDDCLFQAWVTLHISFHQSHHQRPRLPYYRVGMVDNAPRHPAGYVILMFACLIPAVWRRLMMPVLLRWKQQPGQAPSPGRRLTCFAAYGGQHLRRP
jgi:alkane 1-monooxygenase